MKEILLSYGTDLDWAESYAEQLGGSIEGNFIKLPETINTGTRYFLDCGDDTWALYIDVTYHCDLHFIQKNTKTDFICAFYNLTEGEAIKSVDSSDYNVGFLGYNMFIIDSTLGSDYYVKKGSKSFVLCIFMKKSKFISFANRNAEFFKHVDKIMDHTKNTFIKFDRMPIESFHSLNDLRKLKVGDDIFDLQLIGTVHQLLSDYINQLMHETIIIEKVADQDLTSIIETQTFLTNRIEDDFPSISSLARKANMSDTKFKNLFRKITGRTPNAFFMENKLLKAKEIIEEKDLSIAEVADRLSFSTYSYFTSKFKKYFGLTPRDFIKKL